MTEPRIYLLDADVFITAKNLYYGFDLCPGFWAGLIKHHHEGRIFSVDRVRSELLVGPKTENLVEWVRNEVPKEFFLDVDSDEVTEAYTEIMLWAQRHPQYFDYAKAKFATGADGWLVAHARIHGGTVVTLEQPAPHSKREIKLPDVCDQFDVGHENPFSMLKELGVQFQLAKDS